MSPFPSPKLHQVHMPQPDEPIRVVKLTCQFTASFQVFGHSNATLQRMAGSENYLVHFNFYRPVVQLFLERVTYPLLNLWQKYCKKKP